MGNILYLECGSGISGDMTVAALLDLGADQKVLEEVLKSLPVQGFQTKISRVKKSGLDVCDFDVILEEKYENHDHDMEYLHGGDGDHHPIHDHGHLPIRSHHETDHHHKKTGHEHRNLKEILEILSQTKMTKGARETAVSIFEILAEAEASVHGVDKNHVHFHEVGAIDSIVDIVSAAVCLDNLGITQTIVGSMEEGHGMILCQHGMIPVPVPAVAKIAQRYGLSLHITEIEGELVTPTGAAIVAAIRTSDRLPSQFKIKKIGMGAGKRTYERPSILRAMLIEKDPYETDKIVRLETNIDDCTGETLGYVMEQLFLEGARDVNYIPIYMKKNRPAYQLNVICTEEDCARLEKVIFENTTTIGIRRMTMERTVLKREIKSIQTVYGEAKVKVCQLESGQRWYPEYESVAELARKRGVPYIQMCRIIEEECAKQQEILDGTEKGIMNK